MRTKLYTLAAAIFLTVVECQAQSSPELDKGDYAFNNFDFEEALFFFQVANDAMPNEATITRRIADTYRRMGDLAKSAEWYEKTIALNGAVPEDKLYYAEALKYLGKYEDAVNYYEQYNQQKPGDSRALSHLNDRHYFKDLFADTAKYSMKKLNINNENPVIGLTLFEDEKLLVSAVNLENGKTQEVSPFLDVYLCDFNQEKEIDQPVKLDKKVNSKFHDGPVFYSFSEHKLYITRNNIRNGKPVRDKNGNVNLKIYSSEYQNGVWTAAQEMKFNDDGFSTGHACVSKDGQTMYLVSTREGGSGGSDIYQSFRNGNGWSAPINLGPTVNTPGNEMFPFIGEDNHLYFASDGHAGLGGLDIFKSEQQNGTWKSPINLGSPINSCMDDFALVYDKESDNGYFCSNRAGNGDDNIYFYEHIVINKMILAGVLKADDQNISLAGERIHIKNISEGTSYYSQLDENERYEIEVTKGQMIEISLSGATSHQEDLSVLSYQVPDVINDPYVNLGTNTVTLHKMKSRDGQLSESLTNQELLKTSFIINQQDKMDEVADTAEPAVPTMEALNGKVISSRFVHDNDQSNLNLQLPDEAIKSQYEVLIKDARNEFIAGQYYHAIELYEEAQTLMPSEKLPLEQIEKIKAKMKADEMAKYIHFYQNLIMRADEQYSRKEYEACIMTYTEASQMLPAEEYPRLQIEKVKQLLYPKPKPASTSEFAAVDVDLASMKLNNFIFRYKSVELSDEYYRVLDGLIALMKQNQEWILVIDSHTDSRGSLSYNHQLSVQRAQTVEKYLLQKGISREHMQANCYGESRLLNECKDGVTCDETQHEQNRRIEYHFVKRK
jgi:outer membrane protein OmpA-like peptidoglycan-associated protein